MDLIRAHWRLLFGCCGTGSVLLLAWHGHPAAAALAGGGVLLVTVVIPVIAELCATWPEAAALLREIQQPEPPPVPRPGEPGPDHPPWLTAPMPAVTAEPEAAGKHRNPLVHEYVCSRCGGPGKTTWPDQEAAETARERGLPLTCDRCWVGTIRQAAERRPGR